MHNALLELMLAIIYDMFFLQLVMIFVVDIMDHDASSMIVQFKNVWLDEF